MIFERTEFLYRILAPLVSSFTSIHDRFCVASLLTGSSKLLARFGAWNGGACRPFSFYNIERKCDAVYLFTTLCENKTSLYKQRPGYYTIDSNSRILTRIITRRVIVSAILPIKFNRVAYIIIVVSERGTYIWAWANYFYRSIRFFRNLIRRKFEPCHFSLLQTDITAVKNTPD